MMRIYSLVMGCLLAVSPVHSFPTTANFLKLAQRGPISKDLSELPKLIQRAQTKRLLIDPLLNPIDVSGRYAFVAPDLENGDQRGPCPGLNALANHGYLPHNGVASVLDIVGATNEVYGLGVDLGVVLGAMGLVSVGNPLSLTPGFSIGGVTPKSSNILDNLAGLLGTPRGLDGSHNFIEADASLTRNDLYTTGNAWTMNMTLFTQYLNSVSGDVLTIDDLGRRAAERLEECIANNPSCYFGPVTGSVARNAGFLLGGQLLANHSAEFPGGQMTKDVLKSFWAVYEEDDQLTYKEGWEQIPKNWYKRPLDYGLVELNLDLVEWFVKYPILASIGGNVNGVNTFAGVNLNDITGGVLNAVSLLEGNNLVCFAMEIIKTFSVNSLSNLFATLEIPLRVINDAVTAPLLDLDCPAFKDMQLEGVDLLSGLVKTYPGASHGTFAF